MKKGLLRTHEERARMLRRGTLKRIHVDQKVIRQNREQGCNLPPLTVQTSKGPLKAHTVDIRGPSTLINSPHKPLSCGARVWIETKAEVHLLLEENK